MDLNEGQYTVNRNESANFPFYPKYSSHDQVGVVLPAQSFASLPMQV